MKINKLTLKEKTIPFVLTEIPQPPRDLYVLGALEELLDQPMVAIVGSRKVSPYGRAVTAKLAGELAEQGIVIVSGLALGVDSIAHQAALDAGGRTIAVLPAGLDTIYPTSHTQLARAILEKGGALVGEYSEGMPPLKENFIARNRIVSGLSIGVLITEAAEKSGTLHTANFALEQGKTVMAVPGNVTSEFSKGTNNLLKTGAVLVTEANDILNALELATTTRQKALPLGNNEAESSLLGMIAAGTTDGALLLNQCGLSASDFNQTLTMLEISGKIRPLGAGHWGLQ